MNLDVFSAELKKIPMTGGFVEQIDLLKQRYGNEYIEVAESILLLFEQLDLDAVKTSRKYIYDYLKQLDYFIKHQDYGHDDFNNVREKIYDNEKTMLETYMPGLLISYAYTTILYEKMHLFINEFLPLLQSKSKGIEIGFGEGFYLWQILKKYSEITISGFDISPYAIQFASHMLEVAGISTNRYDLRYGNIFEGIDYPSETADFAVLAEVIEHIPNPSLGIREIVRTLKKDGILYITTVINSNHMDHISNFDSPAEVENMIRQENMEIIAKKIYHMTDDFSESKDVSIGLAYVAKKK